MTTLIRMSLQGSVLIALTLLLKGLAQNRLPRRLFPALWLVCMGRLLIPADLTLPAPDRAAPLLPVERAAGALQRAAEAVTPAAVMPPAETAGATPRAPFPWVTAIWATVGLTIGVWLILSWARCRREFRTSLPVENGLTALWLAACPLRRPVQIRSLTGLPGPLTYGLFRPVILVPRDFDWSSDRQARYVLLHEVNHIRRLDNLRKLLAYGTLCVHWFNPLVWALVVFQNRDLELACDEAVLRHARGDVRREYAGTLIALEERRAAALPFVSFFSRSAAEERIRSIMKFNKKSVFALILALILAVAGTVTAFAVAPREAPEQESPVSPDPEGTEGQEEPQVEGVRGFQYGSLDLTVSGVISARRGCAWDGAERWDYPVFVLAPGAVLTVKDAGEAEGYGLCSLDDTRLDLTEGMDPVALGPDAWCVYDRESSLPVLGFETEESDPTLHRLNGAAAASILAAELTRAYELTYGPLTPLEDKLERSVGDAEYLAWVIPHLDQLMTETDGYYVFDVIFPFWVDKGTGEVFKHYDGLAPYTIPFDPEDPSALVFAE